MGLEGNFTCMARRSRFAFVLDFTTDDGRRTTISCDEDLRMIRATCGDSYNLGTDLGRDIDFRQLWSTSFDL